jgi:hypothetical protein
VPTVSGQGVVYLESGAYPISPPVTFVPVAAEDREATIRKIAKILRVPIHFIAHGVPGKLAYSYPIPLKGGAEYHRRRRNR